MSHQTSSHPTNDQPSSAEAAKLLGEAERTAIAVRAAATWRPVAWLTGMAVATVMYLVALGVTGDRDRDVLIVSGAFVACVGGLSIGLLPGSRVSNAGLAVRWGTGLLTWGLLFGAAMGIGMTLLRGEVLYWVVSAVVCAVPLIVAARGEVQE